MKGFNYDPAAQDHALELIFLLAFLFVVLLLFNRKTRRFFESLMRRGACRLPLKLRRAARRSQDDEGECGDWAVGPFSPSFFRITAKIMVLVFLFQGGLLLAPLTPRAQTSGDCTQTVYPLTNHLGSVNTLTDESGAVILTQHFLPFGEDFENPKPTLSSTCNNGEAWDWGFTGQYHDEESGLIYFNARYYCPTVGRFTSPDSVVPNPDDNHSYDRYNYCQNDPINLIDPTGHWIVSAIIGAVVGAIMAAVNGQNVLVGAAEGFVAGACFGSINGAGATGVAADTVSTSTVVWANIEMGAMLGMEEAAASDNGDPLSAGVIGGLSAGIGSEMSFSNAYTGLNTPAKGVVSALEGGVVGGMANVAMGGDFWHGFTQGFESAGLSFMGSQIANEIKLEASKSQSKDAPGPGWSKPIKWKSIKPITSGQRFSLTMVAGGDFDKYLATLPPERAAAIRSAYKQVMKDRHQTMGKHAYTTEAADTVDSAGDEYPTHGSASEQAEVHPIIPNPKDVVAVMHSHPTEKSYYFTRRNLNSFSSAGTHSEIAKFGMSELDIGVGLGLFKVTGGVGFGVAQTDVTGVNHLLLLDTHMEMSVHGEIYVRSRILDFKMN